MGIIVGGQVTPGGLEYENAGAPVAGTDEVQTLTITGTPTGGTFRLKFRGQITATIAYNAAAAAVESALEALGGIGASGVTCAGGALPGVAVTITFDGTDLAKQAQPLITVADKQFTGGSSPDASVAETTPGVDATHRGAAKGATCKDTTNGKLYINTGTSDAPTWTVVGTQT